MLSDPRKIIVLQNGFGQLINPKVKFIAPEAAGSELHVPVQPTTSTATEDENDYHTWTHGATKFLIELYKEHRNSVGSFQIKTMKRLWEMIAEEINKAIGLNISAAHCENRWKVLERNYKKYIDNNKNTGRGRKDFEYSNEMEEIFRKKKTYIRQYYFPLPLK